MSTMCVCGDMVQVAELGSDNLHVPHTNRRTGADCPGHPLTAEEKAAAYATHVAVVESFLRWRPPVRESDAVE